MVCLLPLKRCQFTTQNKNMTFLSACERQETVKWMLLCICLSLFHKHIQIGLIDSQIICCSTYSLSYHSLASTSRTHSRTHSHRLSFSPEASDQWGESVNAMQTHSYFSHTFSMCVVGWIAQARSEAKLPFSCSSSFLLLTKAPFLPSVNQTPTACDIIPIWTLYHPY